MKPEYKQLHDEINALTTQEINGWDGDNSRWSCFLVPLARARVGYELCKIVEREGLDKTIEEYNLEQKRFRWGQFGIEVHDVRKLSEENDLFVPAKLIEWGRFYVFTLDDHNFIYNIRDTNKRNVQLYNQLHQSRIYPLRSLKSQGYRTLCKEYSRLLVEDQVPCLEYRKAIPRICEAVRLLSEEFLSEMEN